MNIDFIGVPACGSGIANHTQSLYEALKLVSDCTFWSIDQRNDKNFLQLKNSKGFIFLFWPPDERYDIVRNQNPKAFIIAYPIFEWTKFMPEYKERLLKLVDKVAFPSEWARSVALENGIPEEKTFLIPCGVNSKYIQDEYLSSERPIKFLFVGKDEKRKSIEPLLFEWLIFQKANPTAKLHVLLSDQFVKNFDPRKRVQFYIGIEDLKSVGVEIVHPPSDVIAMRQLYDNTQYIICPSKAGGIELPLIEGMSRGCIPIATDYSGMSCYVPTMAKCWSIPVKNMVPMFDNRWFPPSIDWGNWANPDWGVFQTRLDSAFKEFNESLSLNLRLHALMNFNFNEIAKLFVKYLQLLEAKRDS